MSPASQSPPEPRHFAGLGIPPEFRDRLADHVSRIAEKQQLSPMIRRGGAKGLPHGWPKSEGRPNSDNLVEKGLAHGHVALGKVVAEDLERDTLLAAAH